MCSSESRFFVASKLMGDMGTAGYPCHSKVIPFTTRIKQPVSSLLSSVSFFTPLSMILQIILVIIATEFMRCNAFFIASKFGGRYRICDVFNSIHTRHPISSTFVLCNFKSIGIIRNRRTICVRRYHESTTACSISVDTSSTSTNEEDDAREIRKERLHHHLNELGVDAELLSDAAFRSVTTTDGFDTRFGKSAIKAYRSCIDPKPSNTKENPDVMANRYARQIDFLSKRHRSREAEWVRHIDTSEHRRTFPLVLVLDNLRSAANVGSIYRSADACGCMEVLTTGITPHTNGNGAEKLAKSALGAERIVTSRHFATTKQALEYLREERPNLLLCGMETTDRSKVYTSVKYPGAEFVSDSDNKETFDAASSPGVALFLGNEVTGVDVDIIPLLDTMIEIPMYGKKNSLSEFSDDLLCIPLSLLSTIKF